MEQRTWQAQLEVAWQLQQQAAIAQAAVDRQRLVKAATSKLGAAMQYEEEVLDLETVEVDSEEFKSLPVVPLPGSYGTALSFIATLSTGRLLRGQTYLWAQFVTSVDEENWLGLTPIGWNSSWGPVQGFSVVTARVQGPFARLAGIRFGCKASYDLNDRWATGAFADVQLKLGVQRI